MDHTWAAKKSDLNDGWIITQKGDDERPTKEKLS